MDNILLISHTNDDSDKMVHLLRATSYGQTYDDCDKMAHML